MTNVAGGGGGVGGPAWERALPGIAVLRRYDRSWLRGDALAGVTVAAYLVPQVMAYAEVAGLPAVTGLWAIVAPLLVYAVLGSSRQLSVGPESTTALMTAAGAGALAGALGPGRYAEVAALLAIAAGLLCLLGYVGRLGFLADLLSGPVLVGYMAGIAALMIVSQLGKVTGLKVHGDGVVEEVIEVVTHLGQAHLATLILAIVVLVALYALRALRPGWPGPLIAILAAAAAVALFDLDALGIRTVGSVPVGLPTPVVPRLHDLDVLALVPAAVGVAIVGYTDNVLTGRAFAIRHGQRIDANQEFLALGVANVAAGLTQGFPVSSSGSRTVLGDAMGSRSQVHSLFALAAVVVTMFALGPVLASFPSAALGAVVIYAATRLVDIGEWRRIAAFSRAELAIAVATTLSVLVLGVLEGIGIALVLSVIGVLRRLAHPHDGILGYVPGVAGMHDVDDYPTAVQVPGLVVYRYDSPLFFANAEDFTRRALEAVDGADTEVEWFVLNTESVVNIDLTAVDALDGLREQVTARGMTFALARVKQDLREELAAAGLLDRIGPALIFPTLPTAVDAYADAFEARHGHRPPHVDSGLATASRATPLPTTEPVVWEGGQTKDPA